MGPLPVMLAYVAGEEPADRVPTEVGGQVADAQPAPPPVFRVRPTGIGGLAAIAALAAMSNTRRPASTEMGA